MKTKTQKISLNKETLKRLKVKSSIKAGRPRQSSNDDSCTITIGSDC